MEPRWMTVAVLLLLCSACASSQECNGGKNEEKKPDPPAKHTNIVLVGATGDLAQRYLWSGLFRLFRKHYVESKNHFTIYAASRMDATKGREKLSEILLGLKCESSDKGCRDMKMKFVQSSQYHPLKKEEHYKKLADKINENIQSMYGLQGTEFSSEEGRLIYLSIPPFAYAQASVWVDKYLRPKLGRPWFRVVLEKPFGSDLASAKKLADSLAQNFEDREIYRIDHFLGKPIVKYVLPFRHINADAYNDIWNRQHIERVEVVLKESLDVKDRVSFYDEVGVIKDMMQNHMTEIATLVAMEQPQDSGRIGQILNRKVELVERMRGSGIGKTITGQYNTYTSEAINEFKKPDYISKTPTFAASVLSIDNSRWAGVPFVLMSGKKLDEKASYVRIVFKDTNICSDSNQICKEIKGQIIFSIASSDPNIPPMILVSKSLPKPKESTGWKYATLKEDAEMFGEKLTDMVGLVPTNQEDAYTTLIEGVYEGQRHLFVDTKSLMASWKLWDPIIRHSKDQTPRLYEGNQADPDWLSFRLLASDKLEFIKEDEFMNIPEEEVYQGTMPKTFRGQDMIALDTTRLIEGLASRIQAEAFQAIEEKGSFHVALSGGRSPRSLLLYLSSNLPFFPWQQTHIWLVDERCVALTDEKSNFNMLNTNLLRHIQSIPYLNIHPMRVEIMGELCDDTYKADEMYEADMRTLNNGVLDFVLLGLGTDGHTASIFPNSTAVTEYEKLVMITEGGPRNMVSRRMTLTYRAINEAKKIVVLVTGKEKHEILHALLDAGDNPVDLPITGVKADDVTWYMDLGAWFGQRANV